MTDSHAQLEAWLVDGALGAPPREIAVHATLCESCTARLGAFDALALIDVAAAGSPPLLAAPTRLRKGVASARLATAVVGTVVAGILVVFGVSQLVGLGGPAGEPAGGPEGTELAGLSNPSDGAGPTGSQEQSSLGLDAAGTPTPGASATPQPGVTPGPLPNPPPGATPRPPTPQPSAPAAPTPTPTPMPSPEPTPTPTPAACDDGSDNDGDGAIDLADAGCADAFDNSERTDTECDNAADDDADGFTDYPGDPGCSDIFDASERDPGLICDDGIDNDGDLLTDFPFDPECTSPTDNDESVP